MHRRVAINVAFPPDAIAVMAEDRRADRPTDEADEIGAEGQQRRRKRV
jgi:hypothetical protein